MSIQGLGGKINKIKELVEDSLPELAQKQIQTKSPSEKDSSSYEKSGSESSIDKPILNRIANRLFADKTEEKIYYGIKASDLSLADIKYLELYQNQSTLEGKLNCICEIENGSLRNALCMEVISNYTNDPTKIYSQNKSGDLEMLSVFHVNDKNTEQRFQSYNRDSSYKYRDKEIAAHLLTLCELIDDSDLQTQAAIQLMRSPTFLTKERLEILDAYKERLSDDDLVTIASSYFLEICTVSYEGHGYSYALARTSKSNHYIIDMIADPALKDQAYSQMALMSFEMVERYGRVSVVEFVNDYQASFDIVHKISDQKLKDQTLAKIAFKYDSLASSHYTEQALKEISDPDFRDETLFALANMHYQIAFQETSVASLRKMLSYLKRIEGEAYHKKIEDLKEKVILICLQSWHSNSHVKTIVEEIIDEIPEQNKKDELNLLYVQTYIATDSGMRFEAQMLTRIDLIQESYLKDQALKAYSIEFLDKQAARRIEDSKLQHQALATITAKNALPNRH